MNLHFIYDQLQYARTCVRVGVQSKTETPTHTKPWYARCFPMSLILLSQRNEVHSSMLVITVACEHVENVSVIDTHTRHVAVGHLPV